GDAAQILSESQPENIFSKDQVPLIKKRVIELYDQFQANGANVSSESYKKYSHRQLSRQIAELLNEIPTSK
ncbi:MAG TPA: hypothetical protein DGG95_07010, partial [Cytophagales bacterium]|nr:hypothetical protein [Cytophagales bacterium]